ncbi:unannotated protein [freshwater metagenome]|uniref:Unannotated protein n=1 Tax=freshwater metagenome TaxID=449393 RepID=A0A6J7BR64_9ZZZZ
MGVLPAELELVGQRGVCRSERCRESGEDGETVVWLPVDLGAVDTDDE